MYIRYVRKRPGLSWHVVRLTRSIEPRTLCGRRDIPAGADQRDTLGTEASCESCARIVLRAVDA